MSRVLFQWEIVTDPLWKRANVRGMPCTVPTEGRLFAWANIALQKWIGTCFTVIGILHSAYGRQRPQLCCVWRTPQKKTTKKDWNGDKWQNDRHATRPITYFGTSADLPHELRWSLLSLVIDDSCQLGTKINTVHTMNTKSVMSHVERVSRLRWIGTHNCRNLFQEEVVVVW